MTKTIKDYIQFAIDNGYKYKVYWNEYTDYKIIQTHINDIWECIILDIIISKPFIKAIARWLWNQVYLRDDSIYIFNNWWDINLNTLAYNHKTKSNEPVIGFIDKLTSQQAIARREWQLEEFITKLLKNG